MRICGATASLTIRTLIFFLGATSYLLISGGSADAQGEAAGDILGTNTVFQDDVELTTQSVRAPSLGEGRIVSYMMTRKKGTSGTLPVAFIYIGVPDMSGLPPGSIDITHPSYDKDFALRGYLAVTVFEPQRDTIDAYSPKKNCTSSRIDEVFQKRADYLQAVIASVASNPFADKQHMIIVADGPAAMDSLALGSRRVPGIQALIAVDSGIYVEGCDVIKELKPILADYGANSIISTLWIYQDNDPVYQRSSVGVLSDAYASQGGRVDLSFLDMSGYLSRTLYFSAQGRSAFLPLVDKFLARESLPAVGDTASDALTKMIGGEAEREAARTYMAAPANKAIAMSASGRALGMSFFEKDVAAAKIAAWSNCRAKSKSEECHVIMVNSDIQ